MSLRYFLKKGAQDRNELEDGFLNRLILTV
jgi:hypothetical protein